MEGKSFRRSVSETIDDVAFISLLSLFDIVSLPKATNFSVRFTNLGIFLLGVLSTGSL